MSKIAEKIADKYEFMAEKSNSLGGVRPVQRKNRRSLLIVLGCLLGAAALFSIGFLAGYFTRTSKEHEKSCNTNNLGIDDTDDKVNFEDFHEIFQQSVSVENLETVMREFSSHPHIAGGPRQLDLANKLTALWTKFGFDKVEKPEYRVLLSYPQRNKPNRVTLVENGEAIYNITGKIKISPGPNSNDTFDHYPYLAYAPSGTVEADLIYANFGRDQDFQKLAEMNVTVRGNIVIIRSRNVRNAEKHGAAGALVYADPSFSAQKGYKSDQVYPNGWWLPSDGVQEGSILFGPYNGDPLTPVLPATKGMFRRPVNESELPRIPAQAISYGDAMELLQRLGGEKAPESWQGGLSITYHVGPGFKNSSTKIKLEVNNQLQEKSIYNVVGTIVGRDEPHRYIIVGNHRDSWSFGAVDALSGTTVTNEIARLLGILLEKGWRPRRTIKICSWGGEEFNLIGSHEWVEENAHILTERAVAYINLDIAVCGDYVLRARTSPLFKQVTYKWARQVKNPQHLEANDTMYDIWLKRTPSDINSSEPRIFNLFSSSDYASFYQYLGIPSADFGYWFGYGSTTSLYPVYHTQQDTFYWVKKFVDQKFQVHKAMTQFSGGMLLDLADQPLLPFDIMNYAKALKYSFQVLKTSSHFSANNISLSALQDAITGFLDTSKRFESKKSDPTEHKSTSRLRMLNDQMVKVEKAFIYPYGLPGKIQSRHVAFNYGFHNLKPGKATFPGVTEALHMAEISNDWNTARKQVSIAIYSVQSANQVLKEPMK